MSLAHLSALLSIRSIHLAASFMDWGSPRTPPLDARSSPKTNRAPKITPHIFLPRVYFYILLDSMNVPVRSCKHTSVQTRLVGPTCMSCLWSSLASLLLLRLYESPQTNGERLTRAGTLQKHMAHLPRPQKVAWPARTSKEKKEKAPSKATSKANLWPRCARRSLSGGGSSEENASQAPIRFERRLFPRKGMPARPPPVAKQV